MKEARHRRPHVVWFQLHKMFRIGKSTEAENILVVSRGRNKVEIECVWVLLMCMSFLKGEMKML